MLFVVESPRWLVDKGKKKEALNGLERIRSSKSSTQIEIEMREIEETSTEDAQTEKLSLTSFFKDRKLWWPLFIVINIHINNELTGLSAVLIYATLVLNESSSNLDTSALANLGITFAMFAGNLFCYFTVERFGRRILLLGGTLGMALTHIFLVIVLNLGITPAAIAGFVLFQLFFTSGPGPIPWFMPPEMFNQASRPTALAVGMFINWIANISVSFLFPILQFHIGYYSFLPFASVAIVEFIFLLFFLPETSVSLANYSMEIFESGKSLIQLGKKL